MEEYPIIAVDVESYLLYGCPYCGYRSGIINIAGYGSQSCVCGECDKTSVILNMTVKKSSIGFGKSPEYPVLQKHPREGIPLHGNPDTRPENGGEFFRARGIGKDWTPGCFVCGGEKKVYNNLAGFVNTKEAGERAMLLFDKGARVDYREHDPDYVQVKIGACNNHLENLEKLLELTTENGTITEEMVALSKE